MIRRSMILAAIVVSTQVFAAEPEDLGRLLEEAGDEAQVGDDEGARVVRVASIRARRELLLGFASARDHVRNLFEPQLLRALGDPRPTIRATAAEAVAVRPSVDSVQALIRATRAEADVLVQQVMVGALGRSIASLPTLERQSVADSAANAIATLILDPATEPGNRSAYIAALGQVGGGGRIVLGGFRE